MSLEEEGGAHGIEEFAIKNVLTCTGLSGDSDKYIQDEKSGIVEDGESE